MAVFRIDVQQLTRYQPTS